MAQRARLEELLGIQVPLIQAPMAGSQDWKLALAVSEAGGLGSIPCGMLGPQQVVAELEAFRARSSKPCNLNFFCHDMPGEDAAVMSAWQAKLRAAFPAEDVATPARPAALRLPFASDMVEVLEPYAPPVLSFHFGLPQVDLLARVKAGGAVILASATTRGEAVWLEQHGADIVIAEGVEAGGHRAMFLNDDLSSQVGVDDLVEQLCDRLTVPVVAAGGVTGNADVRRLMGLGASGVQVGTSFLLCPEATTSTVHRAALGDLAAPTALTNIFSGRPARGIRNVAMRELGDLCADAPGFPYASAPLAPYRSSAEKAGRGDLSPLWAGVNRAGCQDMPAAQLRHLLWGSESSGRSD